MIRGVPLQETEHILSTFRLIVGEERKNSLYLEGSNVEYGRCPSGERNNGDAFKTRNKREINTSPMLPCFHVPLLNMLLVVGMVVVVSLLRLCHCRYD